jgi:nucleotide-binding universal stress UspA family protein
VPGTAQATVGAAPIVVGVDGSRGSDAALAWALEEAGVRGSELEALVVRTAQVAGREHLSYDELTAARCEHLLDESLRRIGGPGEVPLRLETRDDDLFFELGLEAAARGAGLIVVGALSHRLLHGALAPTTLARLTHRSSCPLVIVPSDYVRHPTRRVTVALGWGGEGAGALRWALDEAVVTGADLGVVGESSAAASPDLLVVDMPTWHWRRGGLTPRDPRPGTSLASVPLVWVPRSTPRGRKVVRP